MTDTPTVHQALSAVMADVQAVRKDSKNQAQRFSFRGIDAVMNAVGPALRKQKVVILPIETDVHRSERTLASGKAATEVVLKVTYRVYGPSGDHIEGTVAAEAMDMGDKAIAKAHSVAYRTFLLQALTIPTDEPDPDEVTYEKAPSQQNRGLPTEQGHPDAPQPKSARSSCSPSARHTTSTTRKLKPNTGKPEARQYPTCSRHGSQAPTRWDKHNE